MGRPWPATSSRGTPQEDPCLIRRVQSHQGKDNWRPCQWPAAQELVEGTGIVVEKHAAGVASRGRLHRRQAEARAPSPSAVVVPAFGAVALWGSDSP